MDLDGSTAPESLSETGVEHTEYTDEGIEQQMLSGMDNILAKVAALHQTIEERLADDHVKEEAFNRLYTEVEEVRRERSFQQVRPFLMDLILLYSFRDEILEVLYRCGVEAIVVGSSTFDRTLQQVIKLQPTAFASEHNQVIRVVRRGFRNRNRILRSEEVIVNNYKSQ